MHRINWLFLICVIGLCACDLKDKTKISTSESDLDSDIIELNTDIEIIGLLYHRFGENKYPSTNISTALFREQLTFLKNNEFKVIPFSKAIEKLHSKDEKGRFIVITIDDAFKSFMTNGFPVLNELDFEATLFINTETVGSGDYLGWEELRFLMNHGIEIGNHTHTHGYFLDENSENRQQIFIEDVQLAQKIINEKLNINPKIFAYPYGEYDKLMKDDIEKMGFMSAAAQNSGVISKYSDLYALPRFPMTNQYGKIPIFKEKIMMHDLPVVKTKPESTIAYQNPPELEFHLDHSNFSFSQMQCFIQGANCEIVALDSMGLSYRILSDQTLNSRRHLYTITVPDKDNKNWYWFSYQWIFPETSE